MAHIPQAHTMSIHASIFSRFARRTEYLVGHPAAFLVVLLLVVIWIFLGRSLAPKNWQEPIWTGTSILTLLMVFLLQHTANRDAAAIQLKLDEILRSIGGAHNALISLENLTIEDLQKLKDHYERLANEAREQFNRGQRDTDSPDVEKG